MLDLKLRQANAKQPASHEDDRDLNTIISDWISGLLVDLSHEQKAEKISRLKTSLSYRIIKLFADLKPCNEDDPEEVERRESLERDFYTWLLSASNSEEKEIALMRLFDEIMIENEADICASIIHDKTPKPDL